MNESVWTTPPQITERLRSIWKRGDLLRAQLGESYFPLELSLKKPTTTELAQRFTEVREWILALEKGSKAQLGFGYEIVWTDIKHRILGNNRVPLRVVVTTNEDALRLIKVRREAAHFSSVAAATIVLFPELRAWILHKPLVLLEQADAWERIMQVLLWFRTHPHPDVYLRQLDIAGVDTKFIEQRKGLLSELLDLVLAPEALDASATGARAFERRYGLRPKPTLIRFRVLDENLLVGGFSDLSVPEREFARTTLNVDDVFITENDANGLAFPNLACSIVLFGLGYGVELLAQAAWLSSKRIHYWGDIDTHGFAMLSKLRKHFPHATSLLMDRSTLESHRELWTHEAQPTRAALEHLTPEEFSLYDDLRNDRLGAGVRLEQERIAFGHVRRAIELRR